MIGELVVARLEVVVGFSEFAVSSNAATDTGAEGEINALMIAAAGLGDSGEVAVILDKGWFAEVFLEFFGNIETLPREIAKPSDAVIFDDARHGDAEGEDFAEDEVHADLLTEVIVEGFLIGTGREFNGVQDFALATDEGDEGFSATNVDT